MTINCAYTELVDLHKLQPNPKNPNTHPDRQIELLAKIIDYQGQRSPIVVSKRSGFITKGHGRLMALQKLGWEKAAVDYQDYEDEAQEYADIVADNKIAELAKHDDAKMIDDLKLIDLDDFELLGMDDFELPAEPDATKEDIEDDVPTNVDTRCKPGDLWQLGEHRLLCGDSTNIQHVERLMAGEKADITFTSPPYNAGCFGYDGGKDKYKGKTDNKSQDEYFDFLCSFTNICLDVSSIVFFNNQFLSGNRHALAKFIGHYSGMFKDIFPWIKNTAPPNVNKGVFTNRFEIILALEKDCSKKGFNVSWQGKYHNVIDGHTAAKENVTEGKHSATMPLYVIDWFIERLPFIKTIYDPFGGSGSTLIACEKTNRKCFMMELDPHYCDVIISRWEKYSGKGAERVEDGKTS